MKIYTKTGDKGETSLVGGTRVSKSHFRLDAYGTVDELNSHLGLICDSTDDEELKDILLHVQYRLFSVGADLANEQESKKKIPVVTEEDIEFLERRIDKFNETIPPIQSFILPGGHPVASMLHIARTVCRRAERHAVKLANEEFVSSISIKFINRLSDFLFVAARKILNDNKINEIPWKPYL